MFQLSRRRLLHLGAATLVTGSVAGGPGAGRASAGGPLTLKASSRTLEVNGKAARVLGLAQADGVAGLFNEEKGRRFQATLVNELETDTLVHWHGLTPPSEQDGVPGLSQPALPSGQAYDYDFLHNRAGTFWMHSHLGLQEQQLLAAPLIVHDPAEAGADEQEIVVLLHDFSFRSPEEIYAELRRDAGMEMSMEAVGGHDKTAQHGGMAMELGEDEGHGGSKTTGKTMGMGHSEGHDDASTGMDMGHGRGMVHFNDVDYDAYLANDRTLADPEVVRVDPGGQLRLRMINAAAATNFVMNFGSLAGDLIAVDGNPIKPLKIHQFDLAIAQRADIRLRLPAGQGAYPVLALREDGRERTGIILATKSAAIGRLSQTVEHKIRPLDLGLERQLVPTEPLSDQKAQRVHNLALTGSHAGYDWGLNGKVFDPADPLYVTEGERVEIIMQNKTAMPHPIHLHGHHFQVVAIDGERFSGAVRDTVLVPPERSVTIAFDADNPGHWAFHCHQLYHMAAGMMTSVRYEGYERA